MDLELYTHGRCHIFAVALSNVFGYKIESLWDFDHMECEGPVLIHMYCVNKDIYFDATGKIKKESLFTDYGDYPNEPVFLDGADLDLLKPKKNEIKKIVKYINQNKEKYS